MEAISFNENTRPPDAVAGALVTATEVFDAERYATVNKRRRLVDGAMEITDEIIADGDKELLKVIFVYLLLPINRLFYLYLFLMCCLESCCLR